MLDVAYIVRFVQARSVCLLSEATVSAVGSSISEFGYDFSAECSIQIRLLEDLCLSHVQSAFEGFSCL